MQIQIDRPQKENIKEIEALFCKVIVDTFNKNAIQKSNTLHTIYCNIRYTVLCSIMFGTIVHKQCNQIL